MVEKMVMQAFVQSLEEMTGLKADITALKNEMLKIISCNGMS